MNSVALLQELVRAPSLFGEEHAAVAIIDRELRQLHLDVVSVPFDPETLSKLPRAQPPFCVVSNRRNLIARLKGSGGGRSLILNCHLDVVPPGDPKEWEHDAFSGTLIDGCVYGRGAYDDKAGAVICLAVLERLAADRLAGDVMAYFVLEDETTRNGSLLCLDAGYLADAAIIIDGTRGERGINQHGGNIKFRVTTFGKSASVSVSHVGLNAAELLAQVCSVIKTAAVDLNKSIALPWSQFPCPNQVSIIALNCEEVALTVPARAAATLYATFTPPHTVASFITMVRDIADWVARKGGVERLPEIHVEFAAEPVMSIAAEIEQAIRCAAGRDIPFGPSTGTSDMTHFVDRQIPCVLFGPGRGYNPHRANERFEVNSLEEMTALLSAVAREWCK
jgi:acetylornithine deacetylase